MHSASLQFGSNTLHPFQADSENRPFTFGGLNRIVSPLNSTQSELGAPGHRFQMKLLPPSNGHVSNGYRENHESIVANGTLRSLGTVRNDLNGVDETFDYSEKLNGSIGSAKLKAFSSSSGSLSKHFKHHKIPSPHRSEEVFKALNNALNKCIDVTQQDILALRMQCDNVGQNGTMELLAEVQRQSKAAERYLKRLEFHMSRVEEVEEQYELHLKAPMASSNHPKSSGSLSRNVFRNGGDKQRSPTNSHSLKNGGMLKELSLMLTKLESELEILMGTLSIQLKGMVGFARLAPGDVFEVNLKFGTQKWKSKGRVGLDRNQVWESDMVNFKCLLEDMLDFKVVEVRTFGKSLVLIEKSFDPLELFSPHPQLMTVDLNRNGSLKLDLIATWNPLDSLMSSLSRTDSHWSLAQKANVPVLLKTNFQPSQVNTGSTIFDPVKFTTPDTGTLIKQSTNDVRNGHSTNSLKRHASNGLIEKPLQHKQSFHYNGSSQSNEPCDDTTLRKANSFHNNVDNDIQSTTSLLTYLRRLRTFLQTYEQTFPELQSLNQLLVALHSFLKVDSSCGRSAVSVENALGCFDFLRLENMSQADIDDLDNNVLNGSSISGRSQTNSYCNGSNESTPRARRYLKKSETYQREMATSTLNRRQSLGALTNQEVQMTTGSDELDLCLCHHFQHCEQLLEKLKSYGPLHHRKQEALYKLSVETAIVAQMLNVLQLMPPLPKIIEILADLDANTDLQDVWLSACGVSQHGYFLSSVSLKHELKRIFHELVSVRYPDLVEKVFDKVLHLLSDRSSWNTTIVTVYQFVFCFKNKHLPIFIESLAHETWIIENLRSRNPTTTYRVMERLKQVPVPPPPDCLRYIGAVLIDENRQISSTAESYLIQTQGALREDLINTYMAFLEHEDSLTRRGACRALSLLQARRCISALLFVSSSDHNAVVRDEARRGVLSFGVEGKEALKNMQIS